MRALMRTIILTLLAMMALTVASEGFLSRMESGGGTAGGVGADLPSRWNYLGRAGAAGDAAQYAEGRREMARTILNEMVGGAGNPFYAQPQEGNGGVADGDFVIDADDMEIVEPAESRGEALVEVPESLFYEDFSSDAYAGSVEGEKGAPAGGEAVSGESLSGNSYENRVEPAGDGIEIRGIITGEGADCALVNGEIWKEGDRFPGFTVVSIETTGVTLVMDDGRSVVIGM